MQDIRLACVCNGKGTCVTCKIAPSPATTEFIRAFKWEQVNALSEYVDDLMLGKPKRKVKRNGKARKAGTRE